MHTKKIFLSFCFFSIFYSMGFAHNSLSVAKVLPHLFFGIITDVSFFEGTSKLTNSTKSNGTKINNITISENATSRELGIRFLSGYQFINMIDIYIGLGGSTLLTSQSIGKKRIIYVQKNTLLFELNTKGTWYIHKNIGIYVQMGGGLSYIYLISAGGSRKIDLGLQWNDIGGYTLIGLGNSILIGDEQNHRFSIGIHNKFMYQNDASYFIKSNDSIKKFIFGVANFLIGFHFEYVYIL